MTECPVLGRVCEQSADLEQSSLRNDNFLEADSYLSSEYLKNTHHLLRLNMTCTWLVYTVTDVDGDPRLFTNSLMTMSSVSLKAG